MPVGADLVEKIEDALSQANDSRIVQLQKVPVNVKNAQLLVQVSTDRIAHPPKIDPAVLTDPTSEIFQILNRGLALLGPIGTAKVQ